MTVAELVGLGWGKPGLSLPWVGRYKREPFGSPCPGQCLSASPADQWSFGRRNQAGPVNT